MASLRPRAVHRVTDRDAVVAYMVQRDTAFLLLAREDEDGSLVPLEARFMPASSLQQQMTEPLALDTLGRRWFDSIPREAAPLLTTQMREMPVGSLLRAMHRGRPHRSAKVDPSFLFDKQRCAGFADAGRSRELGFANSRVLGSRLDQLRAAVAYSDAIAADDTSPLDTVAERLQVPRSRADQLIQFARKNGYLTAASGAGRAGGRLTDAAIDDIRRMGKAIR